MTYKCKDQNTMYTSLKPTQPTIWALRRNVRVQDNQPPSADIPETPVSAGTLYEHLFGYDPIRVLGEHAAPKPMDAAVTAENPKLNILNPQTGFLVREIASDDPVNT